MFKLRELPFNPKSNAVISEKTCSYHYGKHHATYVANLNNLIKNSEFSNLSFYDILIDSKDSIYNNAAQVYNHDFYWDCIANKSQMSDELKNALENELPNFKEDFLKAATTLFGSGWAWLVFNPKTSKLEILQTQNAVTPINNGKVPILVVDVWEHAYYIDYFNARLKYLEIFFENINWKFVSEAYEWAKKEGLESVKHYTKKIHAY